MKNIASPYSTGLKLGALWKDKLRKRIAFVKGIQKKNRIPDLLLDARTKDFAKILERLAPDWLKEAKGIAEAAGTDLKDYLKINCLPSDFFSSAKAGNCTSFISIGRARNMLFKIRDEKNYTQVFYTRNLNGYHYQAGHDIGNIGTAHFFSSRGLAGANNTGSVTDDVTDDPALSDCHVLRFLAENASSVKDVPLLIEKLIEKKVMGGAGKNRGSIFLLADSESGVILECTSKDFAYKFIDKGLLTVSNHFTLPRARQWESEPPTKNTLLRKKRIDEILGSTVDENNLQYIFDMSRDRKYLPHSLCNDDSKHFWMTISAQLQLINRKQIEDSVNYICCGNTRHSFFLPFPINATENFTLLANGQYYSASDALYKRFECSNHMKKLITEFERKSLSGKTDLNMLYKEACSIFKSEYKQ